MNARPASHPGSLPARATARVGQLPGPRLPRWAQALAFRLAPLRSLQACQRRYGDLAAFPAVSSPRFVVVFDPGLVKQLLADSSPRLSAGQARARQLRPALMGRHSLVVLDNDHHVQRRRSLLPPLHGERVRAQAPVIRRVADLVIDTWPLGVPFPLLPAMRTLNLSVMLRVILGLEEEGCDEAMRQAQAQLRLSRRGQLARRGQAKAQEGRRALDALVDQAIVRRRAAGDLEQRADVLSMLLVAGDQRGAPMSDRELRDDLITLLLADQETTSPSLTWAFELLVRHPAALERLQAELADGDERYLQAVIKETLRLRAPAAAFVSRVVDQQPYELGSYAIPPGTEMRVSLAALHRRADHYPEPLAFRPERFLGEDPPGLWMPFGWGVHRCLAASFATLEMTVVIRRVLERVHLVPARGRRIRAVRAGLAQAPAGGIRMVLAGREPAGQTA